MACLIGAVLERFPVTCLMGGDASVDFFPEENHGVPQARGCSIHVNSKTAMSTLTLTLDFSAGGMCTCG